MDSIDIGMYIAYVFFIVALAAAVILPAINAVKSPAGLVKSLMGVGGLVLLFVIAYVISGSEVSTKAASMGVDESGSKLIGAGLIVFYFVLAISVVGVVFSEINKALK
jgi:hypothetical protein